jgi:hypothetical protein
MKYIVSWTLPIATFHAAVGRFLETGGMPPAGVKLVGRWHGMSLVLILVVVRFSLLGIEATIAAECGRFGPFGLTEGHVSRERAVTIRMHALSGSSSR